MPPTERELHQLYKRCEEVLGPEHAAVLMETMPKVDWSQVATKADLAGLATKSELAELRSEARSGLADLRSETRLGFADLRSEMQSGLAELRSEMASGFGTIALDLERALRKQTYWILGVLIALASLVLANGLLD